jgi:PEGA domain
MKESWFLTATLVATSVLVGCGTPDPPGVERGPHNTIAYDVVIEASEPGARIEADGNNLGNTPVHVKIFGDRDGTFHDFGSYSYVIRAYPLATNQFSQVRVFGTGKGFQREDKIPQSVYFDMNQKPTPYPAGAEGEYAAPGYYYYEGPAFYWGPAYYYGPRYRYYYGPRRYYRRY